MALLEWEEGIAGVPSRLDVSEGAHHATRDRKAKREHDHLCELLSSNETFRMEVPVRGPTDNVQIREGVNRGGIWMIGRDVGERTGETSGDEGKDRAE